MTEKLDLQLGSTQLIIQACLAVSFTRPQIAYALATSLWETARTMEPVEEAFWLSDAWRKKNLRYYPWHGRGFVQLTWEENYIKMAKRLNRPDIVEDPTILMRDHALSAEILAIGMLEGTFTGKRLDAYVNDTASDFRGARRVINGTDKAAQIAKIANEYLQVLPKRLLQDTTPGPKAPQLQPKTPPPKGNAAPAPTPFAKFLRWLLSLFAKPPTS